MSKRDTFFLRKKTIQTRWIKKILANKRHKFVASVIILSLGLFLSEYFFGRSNLFVLLVLSVAVNILFFSSIFTDIKGNFSLKIFILPFIFTISFGLFYSLVPARFLTRSLITLFYAIGLYSLFLSQNIFIVSSIRTITLLSSARIVSFVITLVSYFFLSNIIFSLHISILPISIMIFVFSLLLIYHSLWTHTLDKTFKDRIFWVLMLSFCLFEVSLLLSFWPTSPTVIALFLTGFFYTIVGLTQVWFDKRLFKGVIWEYIWVAVIVFFILILFTSWK